MTSSHRSYGVNYKSTILLKLLCKCLFLGKECPTFCIAKPPSKHLRPFFFFQILYSPFPSCLHLLLHTPVKDVSFLFYQAKPSPLTINQSFGHLFWKLALPIFSLPCLIDIISSACSLASFSQVGTPVLVPATSYLAISATSQQCPLTRCSTLRLLG